MQIVILILILFLASSTVLAGERHRGWYATGALAWHSVELDGDDDNDRDSPAGMLGVGASLGGGYRGKGRLDVRFLADTAFARIGNDTTTITSPDALAGVFVEPLFHFRRDPSKWDPYLILPEVGFMYLFRNATGGPSIAFPSVGLQVHFNERWSGYAEFKVRLGLLYSGETGGLGFDALVPIGIAYRF